MASSTDNLEAVGEAIRAYLGDKYCARERALQLSREATRHAANAIRALHRDELDRARELIKASGGALAEARGAVGGHMDVYYAGYIGDAEKEYTEAATTLALTLNAPLPEPTDLGVSATAYLHGIGEAVGEIRRYILDQIRRGDTSRCESLLSAMDDIYTVLVTMDFPDGMTGGLRRTTDVARGILEKTRGDLTLALRQQHMEGTLRAFEERIRP